MEFRELVLMGDHPYPFSLCPEEKLLIFFVPVLIVNFSHGQEVPVKMPHLNRLTGWRWWRQLPRTDDSERLSLASEAKISGLLLPPNPCAIGKIGTTELMGLEYLYRHLQLPWPPAASWRRPAQRLHDCSGLFPVRKDIYLLWAEEYRQALGQMDLLAQWQPQNTYLSAVEDRVLAQLAPQAFRAHRNYVHPLHPPAQWLGDLTPLRWLVIHPFAKTIRAQLPNLAAFGVFPERSRPDLGPRGRDTRILACPQFAYMAPPEHPDWVSALEALKQAMEKEDFDIALIGAGAWSLPLAAHAKKLGRKGFHLGGVLQLLFGIRGGRFDGLGLYNDNWIRPLPEERPKNFQSMENGAYW
jgi:hypothetical protein